jgi:hypothetical protein
MGDTDSLFVTCPPEHQKQVMEGLSERMGDGARLEVKKRFSFFVVGPYRKSYLGILEGPDQKVYSSSMPDHRKGAPILSKERMEWLRQEILYELLSTWRKEGQGFSMMNKLRPCLIGALEKRREGFFSELCDSPLIKLVQSITLPSLSRVMESESRHKGSPVSLLKAMIFRGESLYLPSETLSYLPVTEKGNGDRMFESLEYLRCTSRSSRASELFLNIDQLLFQCYSWPVFAAFGRIIISDS